VESLYIDMLTHAAHKKHLNQRERS